jgi:opacity protein-like surface antigen
MKQISRMIIALCLPLMLWSPAWAACRGPYVGVLLGGNALMTAKSTDNEGNFDLRFNPGLVGSAVVGWEFEPGNPEGEGRIELEYTHRTNRLDQTRFADGVAPAGGNLTADSLLVNFYGVFHDANRSWSPYVGAGIGAVRIETSDLTVTGGPLSNDSALALAFQFGLGIDYALTERLSLDLGYRFFSSTRPRFSEVNGPPFKMDYLNNSVVLGLRVGF